MPGSVRRRTLVALVKKISLPFYCWKKLTDWREQVTTWPDLCGLLNSHSDVVCFYPVEFYWIATINNYFNMGCVTFRSPCTLLAVVVLVDCAGCGAIIVLCYTANIGSVPMLTSTRKWNNLSVATKWLVLQAVYRTYPCYIISRLFWKLFLSFVAPSETGNKFLNKQILRS
jgi:hypothetical protein